ncbi:acetolactate synthase small subunit [Portibacter lacus]|uniref:Acetolactate synthase small subunit n=1 Tax=Portibacter lacus TaxID=1099794 RepID=A0AA37WG27_9BACT|nr:acetolactate synthase small subunit [Portibacter lacus]GLR18119.1 acetolactate synthase small subunit [Portibacter lacus]
MSEKKEFTISVFTENRTGLISRVVSIFTRRHINIDSLTTSQSSMEGIHRFTIVIQTTNEQVIKLIGQLDKQIEVLKSFYYDNEEIVFQEIALYKVPTEAFSGGDVIERIVRRHNARILRIEPEYTVIEKTGHEHETEALFKDLKTHGIYEFVRSGRVAISKPMEQLNRYMEEMEISMSQN